MRAARLAAAAAPTQGPVPVAGAIALVLVIVVLLAGIALLSRNSAVRAQKQQQQHEGFSDDQDGPNTEGARVLCKYSPFQCKDPDYVATIQAQLALGTATVRDALVVNGALAANGAVTMDNGLGGAKWALVSGGTGPGWYNGLTQQGDLVLTNTTTDGAQGGTSEATDGITLAPWNSPGGLRVHAAGATVSGNLRVGGGDLSTDGAVRGNQLCLGNTCIDEQGLSAIFNQQLDDDARTAQSAGLVAGLAFFIVPGYFDNASDGVGWMYQQLTNGTPLLARDTADDASNISTFTKGAIDQGRQQVSGMWVGYFRPPANGSYQLSVNADDAAYLWFGPSARILISSQWADLKDPGQHSDQDTITIPTGQLTAQQNYPIRIIWGNNGGPGNLRLTITHLDSGRTSNGPGYLYSPPSQWINIDA